jgi:hypothetical protein
MLWVGQTEFLVMRSDIGLSYQPQMLRVMTDKIHTRTHTRVCVCVCVCVLLLLGVKVIFLFDGISGWFW